MKGGGQRGLTRRELFGSSAGAAAASLALAAGCASRERTLRRAESHCQICTMRCGVEAYVDGDRLVSVHGRLDSHTRGFTCANGLAVPEWLRAPNRVSEPMVRRSGGFESASWSTALDAVVARLKEVRERHGARAIAVQSGWALVRGDTAGWIRRLCDALGTPNYISSSSICVGAAVMSNALSFGRLASSDLNRTSHFVLWGSNPMQSAPPIAHLILRRKNHGMRFVVVDPRKTKLAQAADLHLAIRPGTDLALALAMLGVIVRESLYDAGFVKDQTIGFEELAAVVEPLTPEWAAPITGIDAATIDGLAREIAAAEGASVSTGLALEHSLNGVQTCRAVEALWTITGNVGRPGGMHLYGPAGAAAFEAYRTLEPVPPPVSESPVGAAEHPLFTRLLAEAQGNLLPRAILDDDPYPVRALLVFGANPALSAPDTAEMRRALERLDLLVVADPVLSETASMADVVLPVATFIERDSHIAMRGIGEVPAAVSPRGQSRPDWQIAFDLASRLGLERYFPWADRGAAQETLAAAPHRKERGRYLTPSGKIELASAQMGDVGLSPVPRPARVDTPPSDFPLLLVTGLRRPGYCNSQMRGAPLLEQRVGPPTAGLAAATARSLGVGDGQRVRIETEHGAVEVPARIHDDLIEGIVVLPHCVAEANANQLTSVATRDPVSGFPNLRSLACRVRPAGEV